MQTIRFLDRSLFIRKKMFTFYFTSSQRKKVKKKLPPGSKGPSADRARTQQPDILRKYTATKKPRHPPSNTQNAYFYYPEM